MVRNRFEIVWMSLSSRLIDTFYHGAECLAYVAVYLVAVAALAFVVGWASLLAAIPWLILRYFAGV
jgi:hypothetical protein